MLAPKVVSLIAKCCCFGLGNLLAAGVFYVKSRSRLMQWPKVLATVTSSYQDRDNRYVFVVKFKDVAGVAQCAHVKAVDAQNLGLGSEIEIAYNPENPSDAVLKSWRQVGLKVIGLGLLGVIFLYIGVSSWVSG